MSALAVLVEPVLDEDTGSFWHIVYQLGSAQFGNHGPDNIALELFAPPE